MFKLVISDDEGKTTVVPLVRDEITIGRKEGNTIRLTERNVSRRHARLRREAGHYFIEDLNSYNGVKINGRRIEGELQINQGDQVTIGDYVLALQSEATASPQAPAAAPGEPVPPARLVMLTPPAPGAEFALTRSGMRIGRAEDLDVWINHRSISREHAEVQLEGDVIKVLDLGSANGLRLNGEDIREAALQSGDVLELGQVRFRFVGAGEAYVFEADRTVQMDALTLPEEPTPSRAPLIAAIAIVLVAIGVGAAIAFTGGDPESQEVTVEGPTPDPTPSVMDTPQAADPRAAAIALIARCRASLGADDFAGAIAAAEQALQVAPGDAEATGCANEARAAQQVQTTFDRGVAALAAERYDEAYFAFEELPENSPLRQRPEIRQARDQFVRSSLERANEAINDGDMATARSYANNVLTLEDLPRTVRGEAEAILQRTRPTTPIRMSPRSMMSTRMDTVVAAMDPPPSMTMSMSAALDPSQVMRECNYVQRCVARTLAGRANTARSMGVLVEAYRSIGDSGAARRTMEQLIRRFPNSSQANRYRRQL
ncbi:MAG: FHA domain-containing protein [Myxococcota bacterium]